MQQFTIPELQIEYYNKSGSKNKIIQLLAVEITSTFSYVGNYRGFSVIKDNTTEIKYCFVLNKNSIPEGFDHVLLTKQKVTEAVFTSNTFEIKSWLKHPLSRSYTNEEIIESWEDGFNFIEENIGEGKAGMREPQIAGLFAILSHLKVSEEIGTVVMPTGTGKTETMLAALVANRCKKILITVPSDALRNQLALKFISFGLLKKFGVISEKALFPKVGIIYQGFDNIDEFNTFIAESNVIITTMGVLSNSSEEELKTYADNCTNLFIDEAHHVEAASWNRIRGYFPKRNVLQFTATPFRNDRKRLEGKIIFNFSLKKAQEQGYFKPITFLPIREYDFKKADGLIAEKAVNQLREDISNGYDHILMARCENKTRAQEVFEYYETYADLNPTLIYSGITDKKEILEGILKGEHKIIVAVNMLGEGFDLPQLKIAAFHDIRKSLPITLQFAGRFTRTSSLNLGNATFVANLADSLVTDELSELYAQDSDWNSLLSKLSAGEVEEQLEFDEFINGFQHLDNSKIPFQNIRFALSTVVFKNNYDKEDESIVVEDTYDLSAFPDGFSNYDDLEYKFSDYNPTTNTVVIITANKSEIDWVNYKEVYGLDWKLTVLFYDEENDLLFIHSSDKSSLYEDLANVILKGNASLINQVDVFKSFYDLKRISLQNVGLKEFLNRKIRFTMRVGTDIEEALSISEQQSGQKAFVFGSAYEDGNKVTLGCSYKGRIWSYLKGDLKEFIEWCKIIGGKLINEDIDPNQILRETLMPRVVEEIPKVFPTHVDWDESIYIYPESKISIIHNGREFILAYCSLNIVDENDRGEIFFEIETPFNKIKFQKILFLNNTTSNPYADFQVNKLSTDKVEIKLGSRTFDILDYFKTNVPTVWFADGSALQGNYLVELKQLINPYPQNRLVAWDWSGVNLRKESQGVVPLHIDSIQYRVIQELQKEDFDIIYDDDYSGEIADIITIKETERNIHIQFYHLKYAKDGVVSAQIANFYEVCGQAQKSIHWKHKSGREFFEHLLRRITKTEGSNERNRLEKGTKNDLERLLAIAKNSKPMTFEMFIVQPSLSVNNTSEGILTVLGVTNNYLKEVGNINLTVIANQ